MANEKEWQRLAILGSLGSLSLVGLFRVALIELEKVEDGKPCDEGLLEGAFKEILRRVNILPPQDPNMCDVDDTKPALTLIQGGKTDGDGAAFLESDMFPIVLLLGATLLGGFFALRRRSRTAAFA